MWSSVRERLFLRHITTRQVKQINSQVNNLYALKVQDACKALRSRATNGDLVVERESTLPLNIQPHESLKRLWRSHDW